MVTQGVITRLNLTLTLILTPLHFLIYLLRDFSHWSLTALGALSNPPGSTFWLSIITT